MLRRCFSPIFCNSMYPSKFYYPHYSLNIKKGTAHFSSMHSEQLWCLSHVSQFTQMLYLLLGGAVIPCSFDMYRRASMGEIQVPSNLKVSLNRPSKWSKDLKCPALRIISFCPQNILDGPFIIILRNHSLHFEIHMP